MFRHLRIQIVLLALIAFGCDSSFLDPFENDGRYYSIYGYLDQSRTVHRVRVMEITRFQQVIESESDPQATIDARVYLTDLTTGTRTEWEHSLERLEDGTYGHIFTGHHLLTPRRRYRLEVERSDGRRATAETRIPSLDGTFAVQRNTPDIDPDAGTATQDVVLQNVESPWDIQVVYYAAIGDYYIRVYVPYERTGGLNAENDWAFRINILKDQQAIATAYQQAIADGKVEGTEPWGFEAMGVQLRLLDDNWTPPAGNFDAEILAQPNQLSNVEGGYGFFGSMGLHIEEWNTEDLSVTIGNDI